MSMDEIVSRCDVCGQVWPYNAPTPGAGDCSCIRCEDCGHVFDEGETYCERCDKRSQSGADAWSGGFAENH